ncbi:MAG: hypothetical protein ACE5GU_10355 [Candidatus Scalinduaceae bacterium]
MTYRFGIIIITMESDSYFGGSLFSHKRHKDKVDRYISSSRKIEPIKDHKWQKTNKIKKKQTKETVY